MFADFSLEIQEFVQLFYKINGLTFIVDGMIFYFILTQDMKREEYTSVLIMWKEAIHVFEIFYLFFFCKKEFRTWVLLFEDEVRCTKKKTSFSFFLNIKKHFSLFQKIIIIIHDNLQMLYEKNTEKIFVIWLCCSFYSNNKQYIKKQ